MRRSLSRLNEIEHAHVKNDKPSRQRGAVLDSGHLGGVLSLVHLQLEVWASVFALEILPLEYVHTLNRRRAAVGGAHNCRPLVVVRDKKV